MSTPLITFIISIKLHFVVASTLLEQPHHSPHGMPFGHDIDTVSYLYLPSLCSIHHINTHDMKY
ncbi:hypothetical protein AAZV13_07G210600 [Glycine max]